MKRVSLKSLRENQARINAIRNTMIYGRSTGYATGTSLTESNLNQMMYDVSGVGEKFIQRAKSLRRWFKYKR